MKGKRIVKVLFAMFFLLNAMFVININAEAKEAGDIKNVAEVPETLSWDDMVASGEKARGGMYESDPFNVKTMLYSNYGAPAYTFYDFGGAGTWRMIPVTPKYTGRMYLDLKVYGQSSDYLNIYIVKSYQEDQNGIYNIQTVTTPEGYQGWGVVGGQASKYIYLPVNANETFWLFVQEYEGNVSTMSLDISARIFTTLQRTLTQGAANYALVSGMNKAGNANTTWFKVTPKTTGVLSATIKEYGYNKSDCYVQLYNKNKVALSNKIVFNSSIAANKAYFGVKKGNTYYIKVTQCAGTEKNWYKYGIKYSVTARTDRAIGTKSNAKLLTRKATTTNTLFVASTSNSTDWYKFKVTSKRQTVVKVDATAIKSGSLNITFYAGSKKLGQATLNANTSGEWTLTNSTTYGKANAGTYYVKVVKGTKASGKYSIRYVK